MENHRNHEVISFNEKAEKTKGMKPSKFNEGIMWCENCQEEFTKNS